MELSIPCYWNWGRHGNDFSSNVWSRNTFDERKKAFEAKFFQDEDLKFKLRARRNKRIAEWAAELIGKTDDTDYIKEVRESDLIKPGDDDIIDKLLMDFTSNNINVTREGIIQKLNECENNVKEELMEEN